MAVDSRRTRTRYLWMAVGLGVLAIIVFVLMPRPQGMDILVSLKETNQRIAPAALSCPEWSYPAGSVVECTLESGSRRVPILVNVTGTGVVFVDDAEAAAAIDYLRGEAG